MMEREKVCPHLQVVSIYTVIVLPNGNKTYERVEGWFCQTCGVRVYWS